MENWVIAEWLDESGEPFRAPSYKGRGGVWYTASADDVGPTILLMEGEPQSITPIQDSSPKRKAEHAELRSILMRSEVRQANIADIQATIADMVSKLRQEIHLYRLEAAHMRPSVSGQRFADATGKYYDPPVPAYVGGQVFPITASKTEPKG